MIHGTAGLTITGAWATLLGGPADALEACLAIPDPKRFFNRAFKERRWDGKVRLFTGARFPAGLVAHVTAYLHREGYDVRLTEPRGNPLDLTRLDGQYLGPIGPLRGDLWPHQLDAIRALLQADRGIVKVPTGGGKTEIIAACARYLWEERGWRSLIVVPRRGLCVQTRERLTGYFAGTPSVGQYGDGVHEPGEIVVATAQTLAAFLPRTRKAHGRAAYVPSDPDITRLVRTSHVLWLDEAHHASSTLWYSIALASQAVRRYGLSGTPLKNEDLPDLRLIGATGPVLYDMHASVLIDRGLAAQPKIALVQSVHASGPLLPKTWITRWDPKTQRMQRIAKPLPYRAAYTRAIVENRWHNTAVLKAVRWCVDRKRPTLVLCRTRAHWTALSALLRTALDFHAIWGATEMDVREEVKRQLGARQTLCVLATTIWDEGEDVPTIGAIVLAEGVKVPTNVLQRIGRGMRVKRTGANDVWVVDILPTCHERLLAHGQKRARIYATEGYETVTVTTWPDPDDREIRDDLLPFERWAEARAASPGPRPGPQKRLKPTPRPVKRPKVAP